MCWITKNKPVKLIANKDIPTFKIGMINTKGMVLPFFYQFNIVYEENTTYKENENNIKPFYSSTIDEHEIHRGLHSYALSNIRLKPEYYTSTHKIRPGIQIITHKTTPTSQDVITNGQFYNIEHEVAILLCTIPQGAMYYINEIGEVVSNKIEVKHIIKKPFTLNKDNKTSVRSVDRINKILNNWEKGKFE